MKRQVRPQAFKPVLSVGFRQQADAAKEPPEAQNKIGARRIDGSLGLDVISRRSLI